MTSLLKDYGQARLKKEEDKMKIEIHNEENRREKRLEDKWYYKSSCYICDLVGGSLIKLGDWWDNRGSPSNVERWEMRNSVNKN